MMCADRDHAGAQSRLGKCYLDGQGVPRDPREAVRLFRCAAEKSEPEALIRLGEW